MVPAPVIDPFKVAVANKPLFKANVPAEMLRIPLTTTAALGIDLAPEPEIVKLE